MGADFIMGVLATQEKVIDWQAGHDFIGSLSDQDLDETEFADVYGEYGGAREEIHATIDELREMIEKGSRDSLWIAFGEWNLLMSGGMSWGDDPTDGYTTISKVEAVPGLEQALGFGWPKPTGD